MRNLRESGERLDIVGQSRINSVPVNARAVAIVLCRKGMDNSEIDAIAAAKKRSISIVPVVADLRTFTTIVPKGSRSSTASS